MYKATNIMRTFMAASRLEPERQLPASVLQGARGLAVRSVLRVGAGWSATFGTGEAWGVGGWVGGWVGGRVGVWQGRAEGGL